MDDRRTHEACSGRVALVTGGASGIGRALGAALHEAGARVVLTDVHEAEVVAAAAEIGCLGRPLDVRDAAAFTALVDDLERTLGPVALLFNNAGIVQTGEAHTFALDDWRRVLDVNLYGVVHGVQAVFARMAARGAGRIVNVASVAGLFPTAGQASYVASKFGVVGLSQALRAEGADLGVQVHAVCPGVIATRMTRELPVKGVDPARLHAMVPRGLSAERCAQVILQGMARDRGLILVTWEARLLWWLQRFAPGLGAWVNRRALRMLRRRLDVPAPRATSPIS